MVHGVVRTARFQGALASNHLFERIAEIGANFVLVLHSRDAAANFFALNILDVGQHFLFAEVAVWGVVHTLRREVEGWKRDQVVEHPGARRNITLEALQALISFDAELCLVQLGRHQGNVSRIVTFRDLAFFDPLLANLFAQIERPVEAW